MPRDTELTEYGKSRIDVLKLKDLPNRQIANTIHRQDNLNYFSVENPQKLRKSRPHIFITRGERLIIWMSSNKIVVVL